MGKVRHASSDLLPTSTATGTGEPETAEDALRYSVVVLGDLPLELRTALEAVRFAVQFEVAFPHAHPDLFDRVLLAKPEMVLITDESRIATLVPLLARLRHHPDMEDRCIVALCRCRPSGDALATMRAGLITLCPTLPVRNQAEALLHFCRHARVTRKRTLKSLAGAISHAVNQPLAALLGTSEILTRHPTSLPTDLREALERMRRSAQEIHELVEKLERMDRPETTGYPGKGSGPIIDLDRAAAPDPDRQLP